MRPNQPTKRSRGRGSNNNNNNNNNNRKSSNPLTRSYESNGPEVRIRGTAQIIADKYAQLARDAQSIGDSVAAENHLQHAEHYYRIISAAQAQQLALQQSRVESQERREPVDAVKTSNGDASEAEAPVVETSRVETASGHSVESVADSRAVSNSDEARPKPEPRARRERRPRRAPRNDVANDSAHEVGAVSATPAASPEDNADASAPRPVAVKKAAAPRKAQPTKTADPASAPQPSLNELPAFVTGETVPAAE